MFSIPVRHVFVFMIVSGCYNIYVMRININEAIVAMVVHHNDTGNATSTNRTEYQCPVDGNWPPDGHDGQPTVSGTYEWDENVQGLVLASFFYFYIILQIPGGYLADKVGGKRLITVSILISSILTLLTPMAADVHYLLLVALRFTMGLFSGYYYPALQSMYTVWIPQDEVGTAFTLTGVGVYIGIVVGSLVTGYLSEATALGGWRSNFYLFGFIGLCWTLLWQLITTDKPEDHPRISEQEREHIIKNRLRACKVKNRNRVLIKALTSSLPLWAAYGTQWAHTFIGYLLVTDLPKYFDTMLNVSFGQNGLLMALGNILGAIVCFPSGYISDVCIRKDFCSTTATRKIMDALSALLPALCLLVVTIWPCNRMLSMTLITLAAVTSGTCTAGVHLCYMSMAPAYVGALYGLGNMLANTSGFLVPQMVGWITTTHNDVYGWSLIFYITSGITVLFAIIFLVFGTAELQPWAKDDHLKDELLSESCDDEMAKHENIVAA